MKISREVKTAILVISGIALLIFLFNYLKGENLLDSSRTYYAVYENVEGLTPSAPVTINGQIVGKVQSINFKEDGSGKLVVKLLITNDFEFSKNSTAELYEAGLIGGKAVAIIPAFDGASAAKSGTFLESKTKDGLSELVNQRLTPLQEKIEMVMVSADEAIRNINSLFSPENKKNLTLALADLDQTIVAYKETANGLNKIIADNQESLKSTLSSAENTFGNFSKISDSIAQVDLAGAARDLQSSMNNLNQLLSGIEDGNGTMGKFLKDEQLYDNLEGATKQLEELLQDLKLNPKRYVHFSVFGKKADQYDAEGNLIQDSGSKE
ncbi:MlaD family protein [Mangrovimonas sp. TPBH4]|uniref:MlaD family protein n=1 Tax=Mangrovimonas sp. TPBH4 TaxID=1645914 RepID=UPI0006B53EB7|nr:MlaD family protein [Mangrovimonas sp. TPBH4]